MKKLIVIATLLALARTVEAGYQLDQWRAIFTTPSWVDTVKGFQFDGHGRVAVATTFYFEPNEDYYLFVLEYNRTSRGFDEIYRAQYASSGNETGLAVADLNRDGVPDIVVGHETGATVFLGTALGSYVREPADFGDAAFSIDATDVNGDSLPDLVSVPWSGNITIRYGNGSGGWSNTESVPGTFMGYNDMESSRGDLDGDGIPDTVVMSGQGITPNFTSYSTVPGFPTLGEYTVPDHFLTSGIAVGDFNNDGLADVVLSHPGNSPTWLWVYTQEPGVGLTGPMQLATYDLPESLERFRGCDGRDALAVLHGGWYAAGIYEQEASGGLSFEKRYDLPYATHYDPDSGLSMVDVTEDGIPDMLVADYNNGALILEGRCQCTINMPVNALKMVKGPTAEDITALWSGGGAAIWQVERFAAKENLSTPGSGSQIYSGPALASTLAGEVVVQPPALYYQVGGSCL